MPCYPTLDDLRTQKLKIEVKPMKAKGNFSSVQGYFNCLFRLLREDACHQL